MDKKMFEEPKNELKQTPTDRCMDAFEEVLTDAELSIDKTDHETFYDALKEALYTWEVIHHKG